MFPFIVNHFCDQAAIFVANPGCHSEVAVSLSDCKKWIRAICENNAIL